MKRFFILIALMILNSNIVWAEDSVVINEIMYDPTQNENYNEWIELYNPTASDINLTGWTICGKELLAGYINYTDSQTYSNTTLILNSSSYAIVTDGGSGTKVYDNFNVINESLALHVDAASICGVLSNSGKTIFLNMSNGILSHNITYDPSVGGDGNNKTLCGIPDGNETFQECDLTPGSQNNASVQTSQTGLKIEVCLDGGDCSKIMAIANTEYNKLFKITNLGHISGTTDHINVSVDYNISKNGKLIKESNFFLYDLNSYKTVNTGEWTPNETGTFTICGWIIDSTIINDTNTGDNSVCKNITVMSNPFTMIDKPTSSSFGYFEMIFIKFSLNDEQATELEINNSNLKFLIYSPSGGGGYIIREFDNKIIYSTKGCNSKMAIQINNVTANQSFYLALPFFITSNCNDYYSNGQYKLALRIFNLNLNNGICPTSCSGNKCLDLVEFDIEISGKNDNLCPSTITVSTGGGGGGTTLPSEVEIIKASSYEIVSFEEIVYIGKEFTTKVRVDNKNKKSKEVDIYSYVYEGKKLLSEGFNGEKWGKSWTANKKHISLSPESSASLILTNRIKEDTKPGNYILKVRIKEGNKTKDFIEYVEARKSLEKEENISTFINEGLETGERNLITGGFLGVNNKPPRLLEFLIYWFKIVF